MNSIGLIFGLLIAALVLFYLIGWVLDAMRSGTFEQYEQLRKRFGFELRRFSSRWGWNIGERYVVDGRYRGYSVRVYEHFQTGEKGRQRWTSMTFELLFTGGLEWLIEAEGTQRQSRFETPEALFEKENAIEGAPEARVRLNDPGWKGLVLESESLERVNRFFAKTEIGSIRLSKGFLEYRESGVLRENEMRIRFQDAILILADLADGLSAYPNQNGWEALFEDE